MKLAKLGALEELSMGKVTESLRTYFRPATTTKREIGQYACEETIDRVIEILEATDCAGLGKVCYVFGAGGQPMSTYTELESEAGVVVVRFDSPLPRGLRFIPSYWGLVKINERYALGGVMRKLMAQSTAIVLIFDTSLEGVFLESTRRSEKLDDYSFGIKVDRGHMIYLVDEDRGDSPTGAVHFLCYGTDGPWAELFADISESEGETE